MEIFAFLTLSVSLTCLSPLQSHVSLLSSHMPPTSAFASACALFLSFDQYLPHSIHECVTLTRLSRLHSHVPLLHLSLHYHLPSLHTSAAHVSCPVASESQVSDLHCRLSLSPACACVCAVFLFADVDLPSFHISESLSGVQFHLTLQV